VPVALEPRAEWVGFFGGLGSRPPGAPVLAILGDGAGRDLLAAAARAADDFVLWDGNRGAELQHRLIRLLGPVENTETVSEQLMQRVALAKMVGHDPAFLTTLAKVPVVARSDSVVLILGETGTGKELCARAVHHSSPRRQLPFIPVDCAALPDHLLENELFGHVRGAFTDAHRDQSGLVALAQGGTLFLDEIDSLALPLQAKLLRLIEQRCYKPLGADRFVQANIRIIAASNQPLEELVQQKRFRRDLFFRLSVLELRLPPLRDRRGDIALLARHFLHQLASETPGPPKVLAPTTLEVLARAPWPGNVRELFNVIQRAVVFCEGSVVLPSHIAGLEQTPAPPLEATGFREAKERSVQAFERQYLDEILRRHDGNITRAAREARKDRRAFARLIAKHKIDRPSPAGAGTSKSHSRDESVPPDTPR
jgi:DNA-binding NtrC family response regulator